MYIVLCKEQIKDPKEDQWYYNKITKTGPSSVP